MALPDSFTGEWLFLVPGGGWLLVPVAGCLPVAGAGCWLLAAWCLLLLLAGCGSAAASLGWLLAGYHDPCGGWQRRHSHSSMFSNSGLAKKAPY